MFGDTFKEKYALSDEGVRNVKRGTAWTVVVNLVDFAGITFLLLLMTQFMLTLTDGAPLPSVAPYTIALVAFMIVSFIVHRMQYANTYGTVYGEVGKMRVGLAEQLRKLPLSFFGGRDLADLSETIMSDVDRLEHVWSHVLGYLYGACISTALVAIGLFVLDWRLAIAALWGVPVAFALFYGMRRHNVEGSTRIRSASLTVSDGIQEMLECAREIRATNQSERYLGTLDGKIDDLEKRITGVELTNGLAVNAASAIMRLGVVTTVVVGAALLFSGAIPFMVYFLFLLTVTRIYAPFDQALALIVELFMSEVSARRLREIYETPVADGVESFKPAGHDIVFEDVSFAYHDETVLDGVSFTAREGDVTALVGPSGSGKSTCARLAARLWDANSGTVKVGGIDIASIDPETLMSDYAMVFQDVTLFDDTVMANIRIGRSGATDEEVRAAAKAANCDEFVDKLPEGYDTLIGENGSRLSGGERQRISIARALLKDAPIVLMDEATASLDVENETRVQEALSHLLVGKTVLVIAHRMRTVENADKIVVLADGRVVEEGTPAELAGKEHGVFRHMAELQRRSADWTL